MSDGHDISDILLSGTWFTGSADSRLDEIWALGTRDFRRAAALLRRSLDALHVPALAAVKITSLRPVSGGLVRIAMRCGGDSFVAEMAPGTRVRQLAASILREAKQIGMPAA